MKTFLQLFLPQLFWQYVYYFFLTLEVVVKELAEFVVLLREVRKVYEEPAAHVTLHGFDLVRPGGPVVLHQKVAVLQQTAATDLLRLLGGDQLAVQVVQRVGEVSVYRFTQHGGIEILRDLHPGAVVEKEQGVQYNVETVHTELVFSFHPVHKLKLD